MGKNTDSKLRDAALDGVENKEIRNPDLDIRTDDEKDTLYNDGLDIEDESETYADTHGNKMPT